MRNVNNMLGLIPEWEVEKHGLNTHRRKVGNGYILDSKDLSNIDGEFFSVKVMNLGGIPISNSEARRLIDGSKGPIYFEKPENFNKEDK